MGGDLTAAVRELKVMPGKDIQVPGSPKLVRSLLRDDLLDELNLMICPVVVGSGMRLFDETRASITLDLLDFARFDNGVLAVSYRPRSERPQDSVPPLHFPEAAAPRLTRDH